MAAKRAARKRKDTPAEQHRRFVETAKQLGADETPEAFDRAFKKIASRKPRKN